HDRAAGAAEDTRDLGVQGRRPLARVNHEEHEVRFLDRGEDLAAHALDQGLLRGGIEAAGVYHRRLPALEAHLAVKAVARDAGHVVHERLAPADEWAEERGLTDVWSANDRDDGQVSAAGHRGRPPRRDRKSVV